MYVRFLGQYRTKIVRQMRRQIFRQMKQKAEWILAVFTSIFVKYDGKFASRWRAKSPDALCAVLPLHAICVLCFLYAAFPKNCLSDDSSTTGKQLGIFEKCRIKSIPLALFCVFPLLFQELALTNYRIPHIYRLVKPFSGFSARIQVNIV